MANEAVIIELLGPQKGCPVNYAIADATAVPKGTLMAVDDGRTAIKTGGEAGENMFCGIAAHEKVANDGSTTISCWTHGIFDIYDSEGFLVGVRTCIIGANNIDKVANADMLHATVGIALATNLGGVKQPVLIGSGL